MEFTLESWMNEIKGKRDEFYELNYYTTPQLLALSEELGRFNANLDSNLSIKADVMNLLHSISKKVTAKGIKVLLKQYTIDIVNTTDLIEEKSTSFSFIPKTSSCIAEADNSSHDSDDDSDGEPPQERMKSNRLEPQIQLDDLTLEQTSHLYNLEACGYHIKLILLAFEHCDNPNALAKWCLIHSGDYYFSDEDVSSSETEEEEEDNCEEEEEILAQQKDSNSETMKSPHSLSECFEEIQYLPVDKNHPNVQILMSDCDFSLEECIKAVGKHPNSNQLAMKYLTRNKTEKNYSTVCQSLNSDEEEEIHGNSLESHASEGSLEW